MEMDFSKWKDADYLSFLSSTNSSKQKQESLSDLFRRAGTEDDFKTLITKKVFFQTILDIKPPDEALERHITHLITTTTTKSVSFSSLGNIMDFLKKLSIFGEDASPCEETTQGVIDFLEGYAKFKDTTYDPSSTIFPTLRIILSLENAVPFFLKGAPSTNFLRFLKEQVFPKFDNMMEESRLRLLKALADISPHTTDDIASQLLPEIVTCLKKDLLLSEDTPTEDEDEDLLFEDIPTVKYPHAECLLYIFHHLAAKAAKSNKETSPAKILSHLANSLVTVTDTSRRKLQDVGDALIRLEKSFLDNQKITLGLVIQDTSSRQHIKTNMRMHSNILEMTKALLPEAPPFTVNDVNLSWKKYTNYEPLPITSLPVYALPPKRSKELESLFSCDPMKNQRFSKKTRTMDLTWKEAKSLVKSLPEKSKHYVLTDSNDVAMLSWEATQLKFEKLLRKLSQESTKKSIYGCIRDQLSHIICWAYVSTDLVSGARCIHQLDKDYVALCPWFLSSYCDPDSKERNEEPKPDEFGLVHTWCYGYTIEYALLYIMKHGIPEEVVKWFVCTDCEPPSGEECRMKFRRIKDIKKFQTLEEALEELRDQPVGADLIAYSSLFESGKRVYHGPASGGEFMGYHAVIIERIEKLDGEWVAVCRMSNGTSVGDKGYAYVSLSTQYIPVGVSDKQQRKVRGSSDPMSLLTNFIVPVIDKDEDETEKPEDTDMCSEESKKMHKVNSSDSEEKKSDVLIDFTERRREAKKRKQTEPEAGGEEAKVAKERA